jgi:hypothetical protein
VIGLDKRYLKVTDNPFGIAKNMVFRVSSIIELRFRFKKVTVSVRYRLKGDRQSFFVWNTKAETERTTDDTCPTCSEHVELNPNR